MKIIFITIFVALTIAAINIVPVRSEVIVRAECPQCMCMDAPTCSDVTLLKWGLPFTSYQRLALNEYVDEPYKSTFEPTHYLINTIFNSMFVVGIGGILFVLIKKYKKS